MRQNNIEPTWGYPGYYLFAILLLTIYRLRCFTPPLAMFVWAPNLNDEAPNVSPSHHCTICCRYCLSSDWFHWALLSGSAPSHSHWNWKKTILRNGPVWKQLLFVVVPSLNLNTCLFSYIPILLSSSLENKGQHLICLICSSLFHNIYTASPL